MEELRGNGSVKRSLSNIEISDDEEFLGFNAGKWRRANNATGTSNGHSNQHTIADNLSSASSDDEDLSQKPLQMYLHHQQYYKQMKEFQKQQQQQQHQKDNDASDNEDNVEVN
ncbi:hypothetical protein PVAND_006265 [Polypedilum vanderplanki]|uniref:Uncharacterized protein n=1 Tax=Polypedilum vanderplanki TaxID=319348 RepID=A0A9J6C3N6_POLVA|nr:hypothetical protein PVAND_006265 [Polypedilum vanderplanki]